MTKAQNEAQKRWRQSHCEQYNAYQLELSNKYYQENKEKVLEYKKKKYIYDKQCEILRKILLFHRPQVPLLRKVEQKAF
jgi:hypothetical protein